MKQFLKLFRRGKGWLSSVPKSLIKSKARVAALETRLQTLGAGGAAMREEALASTRLRLVGFAHQLTSRLPSLGRENDVILLAQRHHEIVVLPVPRAEAVSKQLAGMKPLQVVEAIVNGAIMTATLLTRSPAGTSGSPIPEFLNCVRESPDLALIWLDERQPVLLEKSTSYFERLDGIIAESGLIDFHANGNNDAREPTTVPFDVPGLLPPFIPAEPKHRSVLLLHNNYYHFNCLAAGLKRRGWDAVTVSLESPDSPQRQFFHGEDINLYDSDPTLMTARIRRFFRDIPERFGSVHFYGMGLSSLFPDLWENVEDPSIVPWDLLELRRHRIVIGYMPSGCHDGGLQSSIQTLTGGLCNRCVWQLRPDVCSDASSLAWNRKLERLCDWVGLECDHATPERVSDKTVYGPVVTTLDPQRWHPDLVPPEEMRVQRITDEVLVYHAVGNYEARRQSGRDIKGTGAVMAAVEHLQGEGLPVRLIFAHDIPSTQVRFLQVQADIVIDQLNYGRYGANAREAMMLGRPTICRLTPKQALSLPPLRPIIEAPLVDAGEDNCVDVLRSLVLDQVAREAIGKKARKFAVAWHGQEACAERYERVIDRIRAGLPPDSADLYPSSDVVDRVW